MNFMYFHRSKNKYAKTQQASINSPHFWWNRSMIRMRLSLNEPPQGSYSSDTSSVSARKASSNCLLNLVGDLRRCPVHRVVFLRRENMCDQACVLGAGGRRISRAGFPLDPVASSFTEPRFRRSFSGRNPKGADAAFPPERFLTPRFFRNGVWAGVCFFCSLRPLHRFHNNLWVCLSVFEKQPREFLPEPTSLPLAAPSPTSKTVDRDQLPDRRTRRGRT